MTRTERDAFFRASESVGGTPYALIRTMYETASRITEVLHLRWKDIDVRSKSIRVVRIKGSKTVVADITDKLIKALLVHAGSRPRTAGSVVFHGAHRCEERPRGLIRPRKSGMAWQHCTGGHIERRQVNYWIEKTGRALDLDAGMRHPHVFKHTRLVDEARRYKDAGPAAMVAAVRRLSGHATDTALMVYLDEPEALLERAKKTREDMEKF